MDEPAFARRAKFVFTQGRIAAVPAENEVNVTPPIDDERGAAVVVEFAGVDLVGRLAHRIYAGLHGANPLARGVHVGGDVGILVRPRVGDIGHAVEVFSGWMMHRADRVSVAVVGEVIDVGGSADQAHGEGGEEPAEASSCGGESDHEFVVM